jgi:hypothetical protein
VAEVQRLRVAYDNKCSDYENEVESRRGWQDKLKASKRDLESAQRNIDSDPYAVALVDGDGCIVCGPARIVPPGNPNRRLVQRISHRCRGEWWSRCGPQTPEGTSEPYHLETRERRAMAHSRPDLCQPGWIGQEVSRLRYC